ncbi:MAG TPA: serine/threonine-protein kinase [Archangium sp.]|uniref:serine/threonine protein kinase n=1 Tax=Archangium sp. TaxID=1872627 RepID=UPI002E311689|nr:serine/threonine-protein kinase [Archangium sp.]HEX5744669.1 serine/threonine-protein kinase [Archangium sp.]
MTTEAQHPDHLQPGHSVGPWRIVEVLGRGGSSRVFKVERDGQPYSMKMALLPLTQSTEELTEEQYVEETSVYRRLAREAATLFTYSSHPNLLRVYAVDFWPHPTKGYPFIITDFIDGETWHQRRWRKPPHAIEVVNIFSSVVRTVGVLHARGVLHRDLKAENILIRRKDGRPFVIDFGTARIPGALTKTLGLPEGVLHLVPPELLAYTRTEAWKRGEPFQGGVPVDLYALGVLLYQALTDRHPFDPELPDKELLAAIAAVPPAAPHLLNPLVPRSLSDIAMKLLEKRPEDRYPNTEALLEALEQAIEKQRKSPAWKVPLTAPDSPAEALSKQTEQEQVAQPQQAAPAGEAAPPPEDTRPPEGAREDAPAQERRTWRVGRLALVGLLLLAGLLLASWLVRSTLAPPHMPESIASGSPEKGSAPVPPLTTPQDSTPSNRSRFGVLTVWLCTAAGLGCPAAQVRPEPEDCPAEARHNMFEVLKLNEGMELQAIVDIHQPGGPWEDGTYRDGPIVGRVVQRDWSPPELPGGTLLYGRLWTGPGIQNRNGEEAVLGRYTEALLPDGRRLPVCIVLGGPEGRWHKLPGSEPGAVRLELELPVAAVWRWP